MNGRLLFDPRLSFALPEPYTKRRSFPAAFDLDRRLMPRGDAVAYR
jgi:hypothetical protein